MAAAAHDSKLAELDGKLEPIIKRFVVLYASRKARLIRSSQQSPGWQLASRKWHTRHRCLSTCEISQAPPDSEAQSARQAHGFRLPSELLEMSTLRALEDAVVAEWFSGYTSPRYARLAIGPLFGELSLKLKESAAAKDPCRILVWSGHDTSLGGIL